jgi:hypothetical protein
VQGSGIASRGRRGVSGARRPLEAVGDGGQPDRLGAVLALVVTDLARTWMKQERKRRATLTTPISAPTNE